MRSPHLELRIVTLLWVDLTPVRSRRIQFVVRSHPHFRPLFKFAGKHSVELYYTKHMICIWVFSCLNSPWRISFVWLDVGEIKYFGNVRSFRYYSNTAFAYFCMYCSSQDNTYYICLAHNCTRYMVYTCGFLFLNYPLNVLVSCD